VSRWTIRRQGAKTAYGIQYGASAGVCGLVMLSAHPPEALMTPPVILWSVTMGGLLAVFAWDFLRASQNPRDPSLRECAIWSVAYVLLALLFGVVLMIGVDPAQGQGFITEWAGAYTLSVDTVFVFMLIVGAVALPREYRKWVLLFGIGLSLVLRSTLIAVGGAGSVGFGWLFTAFGVLLLYGGWRLFGRGEHDVTKRFEALSHRADSRKGVVLAFVAVAATDVVVALNFIPSSTGVQPYLALSANAFALLPLWRMFSLISGLMDRVIHLDTGLATVLAFVGAQFVLDGLLPDDLSREPGVMALSLGMTGAILLVTTSMSRHSSSVPRPEQALSDDRS
jgi:tellurite resistance protein TerC